MDSRKKPCIRGVTDVQRRVDGQTKVHARSKCVGDGIGWAWEVSPPRVRASEKAMGIEEERRVVLARRWRELDGGWLCLALVCRQTSLG